MCSLLEYWELHGLLLTWCFWSNVCIESWQQLSPRELGLLAGLMRQEVMQSLRGVAFPNRTRNVPPFSPALAALSLKCVESAMQVTSVIKSFEAYNGPLPVPSFDAFVQAHKLLQRTLSECHHGPFSRILYTFLLQFKT